MNGIDYIYEVWVVYPVTIEYDRLKVYLNEEKAQKEAERLNKEDDSGSVEYYVKKTKIED